MADYIAAINATEQQTEDLISSLEDGTETAVSSDPYSDTGLGGSSIDLNDPSIKTIETTGGIKRQDPKNPKKIANSISR